MINTIKNVIPSRVEEIRRLYFDMLTHIEKRVRNIEVQIIQNIDFEKSRVQEILAKISEIEKLQNSKKEYIKTIQNSNEENIVNAYITNLKDAISLETDYFNETFEKEEKKYANLKGVMLKHLLDTKKDADEIIGEFNDLILAFSQIDLGNKTHKLILQLKNEKIPNVISLFNELNEIIDNAVLMYQTDETKELNQHLTIARQNINKQKLALKHLQSEQKQVIDKELASIKITIQETQGIISWFVNYDSKKLHIGDIMNALETKLSNIRSNDLMKLEERHTSGFRIPFVKRAKRLALVGIVSTLIAIPVFSQTNSNEMQRNATKKTATAIYDLVPKSGMTPMIWTPLYVNPGTGILNYESYANGKYKNEISHLNRLDGNFGLLVTRAAGALKCSNYGGRNQEMGFELLKRIEHVLKSAPKGGDKTAEAYFYFMTGRIFFEDVPELLGTEYDMHSLFFDAAQCGLDPSMFQSYLQSQVFLSAVPNISRGLGKKLKGESVRSYVNALIGAKYSLGGYEELAKPFTAVSINDETNNNVNSYMAAANQEPNIDNKLKILLTGIERLSKSGNDEDVKRLWGKIGGTYERKKDWNNALIAYQNAENKSMVAWIQNNKLK